MLTLEVGLTINFRDTSVTVVLIGSTTNKLGYIKYALEQSWKKSNGILGILIHECKDENNRTCEKGKSSFGPIFASSVDDKKFFYERFKTYDWVENDGYKNIGKWIELAAKKAMGWK